MAQQGKKIDEATLRLLLRAARDLGIKAAARAAKVSRNTARKYLRENRKQPLEV